MWVVVIPKTPARGVCVAFRAIRRAGVLAGLRVWRCGVALCSLRIATTPARGGGGGGGWLTEVIQGGAGAGGGASIWCKPPISEKKKKTKN